MAKIRAIEADPPSVTEEIDRWCKKFPRIRDQWEGSIWRLRREPETGYQFADGVHEFLFKIARPSEHFPFITVRYTYTAEKVIIFDIKIVPQL